MKKVKHFNSAQGKSRSSPPLPSKLLYLEKKKKKKLTWLRL